MRRAQTKVLRRNSAPVGVLNFAVSRSIFSIMATDAPIVKKEEQIQEALDLPWNIVVHNDPVNLMSYVTMIFQRVFGYSRERATRHMLEVHQQGRSIVWTGVRERAELYVQQLHGYLLLATLEKSS